MNQQHMLIIEGSFKKKRVSMKKLSQTLVGLYYIYIYKKIHKQQLIFK